MAGRQIEGKGGRRHRLLTAHDLAGIVSGSTGSSGGSAVQSVIAGSNITVDNTDPRNPIVSASGGSGGRPHYAAVGPASTFTSSGGAATVKAVFYNSVVTDPDGLWDPVNIRFNIRVSGLYYVGFHRRANSSVVCSPYIFVNNTKPLVGPYTSNASYENGCRGFVLLLAGDYIEAEWWQNSAVTLVGMDDPTWGREVLFTLVGPF